MKEFIKTLQSFYQSFWDTFPQNKDDFTRPPIKETVLFGFAILIVFVFGFFLWSVTATLESAAVAPGLIVLENSKKTVQHLEGGIVEKINVKNGQTVTQGTILIVLDDTQHRAVYSTLLKQKIELLATQARLIAERDDSDYIIFPPDLMGEDYSAVVTETIRAQNELFLSDKKSYAGQIVILNKKIAQLQDQIKSYDAQVTSFQEQLSWIQKELEAVKSLEAQRVIERPKLWALYREQARLLGGIGEATGHISELEQKIGETEQQILSLKESFKNDILERLNAVQLQLVDVTQKLTAVEDTLSRTAIVAPEDGKVMNLAVHTIGGVVAPGQALLDIVPLHDELVIEAKINPMDIDVVHPGLHAKVQFVSYKQRNIPTFAAEITQVSPDLIQDSQTGFAYYLATVIVDKSHFPKNNEIALYPGMPVQVFVITGNRSPLDYFLSPLYLSFNKAFRES